MICNDGKYKPIQIENEKLRCNILESLHLNDLIWNEIIETFKKKKNVKNK